MIKQLFFSLLLTSIAAQSMELTVLHDYDMLSNITSQICTIDNGDPKEAKKNIQSFAVTDQRLYEYYSREKTQQNIIRQVALHKNLSDSMIALHFGYTTIMNKIHCLFDKIISELTQEDLQDHWYLNSTKLCAYLNEGKQETLLLRAIKLSQFTATKQLITAGIDCNSVRSYTPFPIILNLYCMHPNLKDAYYDIIKLLLKKINLPDDRIKETDWTLLHLAALKNNQRLARRLLRCGANPYLRCKIPYCDEQNAFTLATGSPQGWLTDMVNEIEKGKKNS